MNANFKIGELNETDLVTMIKNMIMEQFGNNDDLEKLEAEGYFDEFEKETIQRRLENL